MAMAGERVDPTFPEDKQPTIGLIGMGEMGRMYANALSKAGWKKYVAWTVLVNNCCSHSLLECSESSFVTFRRSLKLWRRSMKVRGRLHGRNVLVEDKHPGDRRVIHGIDFEGRLLVECMAISHRRFIFDEKGSA